MGRLGCLHVATFLLCIFPADLVFVLKPIDEANSILSLRDVRRQHEVSLDFSIDSRGDQEHSDIRRSPLLEDDPLPSDAPADKMIAKVVDIANDGNEQHEPFDGIIPDLIFSSLPGNETDVESQGEVPSRFDQTMYSFMVPDGKSEKPSTLAVVDFITKKGGAEPNFSVAFDKHDWFGVEKISKEEGENVDVWHVPIMLKAGSDVRVEDAVDGVYKFVVEARQNDVVHTTKVRVDVLSLSPTTPKASNGKTPFDAPPTTSLPVDATETTLPNDVNEIEEGSATTADFGETTNGTVSVGPPLLRSSKVEGSGSEELLSSGREDEDESPLEGVTKIMDLQMSDEDKNDVDGNKMQIDVVGAASSGVIDNESARLRGDVIRGVSLLFRSSNNDDSVEFDVEPHGVFSIRPRIVMANEPVYLFLDDPLKLGDNKFDVVGLTSSGTTVRRQLRVKSAPGRVNTPTAEQKLEPTKKEDMKTTVLMFDVAEDAPAGVTLGKVEGSMRIVGPSDRFVLVGNDIVLSCNDDADRCLDSEKQRLHTLLLLPSNGKLTPTEVRVRVRDVNDNAPRIHTSDIVIRVSDNQLIMPFAIEVLDADEKDDESQNQVSISGDATAFLAIEKVEKNLYQVAIKNTASGGLYRLNISVSDKDDAGTPSDSKSVDVIVENSNSHAKFRRAKYEKTISAKELKKGKQLLQVELEGVPIDEAKVVVLGGNPGWVTVEDYGGRVKVGHYQGDIYSGKSVLRICAVHRKTSEILAETSVVLNVVDGIAVPKDSDDTKNTAVVKVFDREKSPQFLVDLSSDVEGNVGSWKVVPESLFSVDDVGRRNAFSPFHLKIDKNELVFAKDALKNLRFVNVDLIGSQGKVSVLLRLVSTPEYMETLRKEAARPVFPAPWTKTNNEVLLQIPEETPLGHVVAVLPAVVPTTGKPSEVVVEGDMKEAFVYDSATGALMVNNRIDYESLSESQRHFNLTLTTGEPGFTSRAVLLISVVDVDDQPPIIKDDDVDDGIDKLRLREDAEVGTLVANLSLTDGDSNKDATYATEIRGRGHSAYEAHVENGRLLVSLLGELDRERDPSHAIVVAVRDPAGNSDKILLSIAIDDVNDNSPSFDREMYDVLAMDTWPAGVVLERISATDSDIGDSGVVTYSIQDDESGLFAINSSSGVLTTAAELFGRASDEPYNVVVIASDNGTPSLNSTTIVKVRVTSSEPAGLMLIAPTEETAIRVNMSTKDNEKVYTARVKIIGKDSESGSEPAKTDVKFAIKDVLANTEAFHIDEFTGDVFFNAKNVRSTHFPVS